MSINWHSLLPLQHQAFCTEYLKALQQDVPRKPLVISTKSKPGLTHTKHLPFPFIGSIAWNWHKATTQKLRRTRALIRWPHMLTEQNATMKWQKLCGVVCLGDVITVNLFSGNHSSVIIRVSLTLLPIPWINGGTELGTRFWGFRISTWNDLRHMYLLFTIDESECVFNHSSSGEPTLTYPVSRTCLQRYILYTYSHKNLV